MAYKQDKDLAFLPNLENKDLNYLHDILAKDKDNSERYNIEFKNNPLYKKHYPNHKMYWRLLVEELQKFGGNTFANYFRGDKGVLYREILEDVMNELKIPFKKYEDTEKLEEYLLNNFLEDFWTTMSENGKKEFLNNIHENKFEYGDQIKTFLGQGSIVSIKYIFQIMNKSVIESVMTQILRVISSGALKLGSKITGSIITTIIGKQAVKTISTTTAAIGTTASILTGPIGMGVTTAWTLYDIASPAKRVTVPAVLVIAILRKKYRLDNPQKK